MVYMTAPNARAATKIVKLLLKARLIACANVMDARSLYRWKGKVESHAEVVVVMKTRTDAVPDVMEQIQKSHPYEVPCAVSYEMIGGLAAYLDWIDGETATTG